MVATAERNDTVRENETKTRINRLATLAVALGSLVAMTALANAGDGAREAAVQLAQTTQQRPPQQQPAPQPSYFQNLRHQLTTPSVAPPPPSRNQPPAVAGVRG